MPSKAIHVDANCKILFFLWLSSEIHHIFFIHSSVDGYLGCFHVLATVNNATVNTGVHVSFQISVLFCFFYIHPGVELLDYDSSPILSCLRKLILFSIVVAQITFPPIACKSSSLSTSLPTLVIFRHFDDSCSDRCEVLPCCGFDRNFSDD